MGVAAGVVVLIDHHRTLELCRIPLIDAALAFVRLLRETQRAVGDGRDPVIDAQPVVAITARA